VGALATPAAAAPADLQASGGHLRGPMVIEAAAEGKGCSFSQLSGDLATAIASSDFLDDGFDAYDSAAADDFVCARSVRHLKRIELHGWYWGAGGPGESIDVRVLANDKAGVSDEPSDDRVVCSFLNMPVNGLDGDIVVRPKHIPCRLKAGRTYWLQAQMHIYYGTQGHWGWEMVSVDQRNAADWRNPGDGFATGCSTYSGSDSGGDRNAFDCLQFEQPFGLMFTVR
jgi:hypothetical protein